MKETLRFTLCRACSWIGIMILAAGWLGAQDQTHPIVVNAVRQAVAPPLSQVRPLRSAAGTPIVLEDEDDDQRPLMHVPRGTSPVKDSVLQAPAKLAVAASQLALATTSGLNIMGLGTGFPNYSIQAAVPDTNGAVGPTQFVQFVNESFAVFNKSTGSLEYGPANGNTLWQSLGGRCAASTQLDESAQFDKLANRWVMLMPIFADPTYLCVAVSTTSDATNSSWNLYAFELPISSLCGCRVMPDYPKLGVWSDAYYVTFNQGLNLNFEGASACALNRSAMLNGTAATMQCFANVSTSYGALLPGDLDGTTAPPTGSPDYFANFDQNDQSLDIWQFHVNWTTPSQSTFTGPTNIPVAAFTEPCGETVTELNYTTGACVPQSGTSEMLDSYGDRLMYRLAYRNFGSYASLVMNHTVNTGSGSQTGIRWYELRNSGSGFVLHQQGTFAPDSNYRWMGSIAMDKAGDIAMGYSVSSSNMSPSIRYTGRLATDTLGQMESENDVLSAAGVANASQTNTFHWGDYSSIAVDPSDDCTFWYTTQYTPKNGNSHWATRIASFNFPSCTGATTTPQWTLVNKASNFANPLTSLTVPATGSGNLIAVALMFNGGTSVSSVTDNAGNTYVSAGAHCVRGILSTEIWYAVNSKSGATSVTPTFAGSPTHVEMTEWEVSGLSTAAPDAANTATGSVVSNTAGPAVTTSQVGDFVVSVLFANSTSFSSITSGNSFTNDFATDGNGWAHLTSNSAAAGSQQASWYTASPSGVYCGSTVAFLP